MKKYSKIWMVVICICCILIYSFPVNAVENYAESKVPNDFVQLYSSNPSKNVRVYENNETGEKCAIIDSIDFECGETIVLYNNKETNEKVQITVISYEPSVSTRAFYDSGWSGGNIPAGSLTLRAELEGDGIYLRYLVDVTAYPVKLISAYNTYITVPGMSLTSMETYIGRNSAGALPAYATCEFYGQYEQLGINLGSISGYLTLQVNHVGQCRLLWGF